MLVRLIFVAFSVLTLLFSNLFGFHLSKAHAQETTTFWKYQCIDTMKDSRDRARSGMSDSEMDQIIAWQMKTIKSLGANCVAIATPYDSEFLPYMNKWVKAARAQNLRIWFRGNFSGWEGWFNYPRIVTTAEELTKIDTFIRTNPQLFKDGDIFTGAPEAENGGPFGQVNQNNYAAYRQFLIDQNNIEQRAFTKIHKQVTTNWFSMNGDVARTMYDKPTLNKIGNVVTVDHYISDPKQMSDIITYFKTNYNSNFMLGEFGAPIPDINGSMTEEQQADFVDKVFQELYQKRDSVVGINYWDLSDGSTALMNPDQTPRKVTEVIRKYFNPPVVMGKVTNQYNKAIANNTIKTDDHGFVTTTDANGNYSFPTTANDIKLTITNGETTASASIQNMKSGQTYHADFVLQDKSLNLPLTIKEFIQGLLRK